MGRMSKGAAWVAPSLALLAIAALAAENRKEFRYTVVPGASVTISNPSGPVEVKGSSSRQVVVVAITHSDKVEVDSGQSGNRVEATTHFLQRADGDDRRVDYQVQVPQDSHVTVRAPGGPITAEKLQGDISLEGDAAQVTVRELSGAHLRVNTIGGSVSLSNISNGFVDVTSMGGNVQLDGVTGPKVAVNTTKGGIRYNGDFAGGGDYLLVTHAGDIDVNLPAAASVDVVARSITGSVQQDFPLKQKTHPSFTVTEGRSFAGTSNSGASSLQLRSFSGRIRVKKQ